DAQQTEDVGVELHEHLVVRALLDRTSQLDTGVVDEYVDAAVALVYFRHGRLDRLDVAHVAAHDREVERLVGSGVDERLRLLERAHGGVHHVALPGERERGVVAEAARATGDEDDRHLRHPPSKPTAAHGTAVRGMGTATTSTPGPKGSTGERRSVVGVDGGEGGDLGPGEAARLADGATERDDGSDGDLVRRVQQVAQPRLVADRHRRDHPG